MCQDCNRRGQYRRCNSETFDRMPEQTPTPNDIVLQPWATFSMGQQGGTPRCRPTYMEAISATLRKMNMLATTVTVNPQKRPPVPPSVRAKRRFLGAPRSAGTRPWQLSWNAHAKRSSQVHMRTAEKPRIEMKLKFRCNRTFQRDSSRR